MERTNRHIKGFFLLVLLLQCTGVCSVGKIGFLLHKSAAVIDGGANLVWDGVDDKISEEVIGKMRWENKKQWGLRSSSSCEETYGFLPCTTSAVGNLFLTAVYGYLMFLAAKFMTDGCELLLAVMGPGIVGGLFLPILGAFPDALLILVSGISGSKETAQSQVLIGMGLLAGSTVMLLTALWGSCLVVGKCDLSEESVAIDSQDTRRFSLFGSGITTDKSTSTASRIMILQPWVQKRRIAYAKHKHIVSAVLHNVHLKGWGRLLGEDGQLDELVIERIFNDLDHDKDEHLSRGELHGLLLGLELHGQHATISETLDKVMAEFDSSRDDKLNFEEFKEGMRSWLHVAHTSVNLSNNYSKKISNFHLKTREELDNLVDHDEEKETEVDSPYKVYLRAVLLMLGGAVLAGVFADPLVDAVDNFSDATNIPSFFISFIAMPLATNSSEGVSALIFASRKRKQTASLTYSEIYGAVTMNNTLCLGVFLAIVYIRGLDWDFSAEVLVILLVVLVMGLLGSFRTTFPLWMSFVAFLLYPLTLAIVYVLDYVLGWS